MIYIILEQFVNTKKTALKPKSVFMVDDVIIGDNNINIIAGPCSVESKEQIINTAKLVKKYGATLLRGGAFKPRTSPYSFQGLGFKGIEYLKLAKDATGLPIVSEIISPMHVGYFAENVDIIQVGARNMQNYELLKELGKTKKPILLKRGLAATIEEFLFSAEYIMAEGNEKIILCERGIRTFETFTRNTLDINAVPVLKSLTHLPVFVDPSHASGKAWMVDALSKASIAAGADGLMIEVHTDPKNAISDGMQSLTPEMFKDTVKGIVKIAGAVDRAV